jgi:hypothetical protein
MKHLGTILGFALLFTTTAQAATTTTVDFASAPNGAHFANGASAPVCTVSGVTVSCTGTAIEGVGHTNALLLLAVNNDISGVCHNPGNDNVVTPFSKTLTTTTSATLKPSKNGRIIVDPESATGTSNEDFLKTFKCPNPNWRPEVTSNTLTFDYTVTFDGFTTPFIHITGP